MKKYFALVLLVLFCCVCVTAQATVAAPQNPSWKTGSSATATWDAVFEADYYKLTVYVYDESGTTLLGTAATGTSTTEVDVQLEANIVIADQEKEYTTVKLAYTVKAGVTGENGVITYGTESYLSPQWLYEFPLNQLPAPESVVLNADGTASWDYIENTWHYYLYATAYKAGTTHFVGSSNDSVAQTKVIPENGRISYDVSGLLADAYEAALSFGKIQNGDSIDVCFYVRCWADANSDYVDSVQSDWSNRISYSPQIPVESITLSPDAPVVYVGNSYYLGKTITPEEGYYTTIDWSSADAGIASISQKGLLRGVSAGETEVTAAIGDVTDTVPVMVYTISSNITDEEDKDAVTDSAGDIIDDIINGENPDLSDTDISKDDLEDLREEVSQGIWQGNEIFTDMTWYQETFEKYKTNWGQVQKAAREQNALFAGAYNIEVEMYHKEKNGSSQHTIGHIVEFENEINFAFDLPTGMAEIQSGYARKYVLVRIHKGEMEEIPVTVEDGTCKGKSDKFSDFVLVYVDELIDHEHTEAIDNGFSPTCTEPGLTEGKHCSVCNEVLVAQEEIPALGHTWDEGVITSKPTIAADGTTLYTCIVCDVTQTEPLPFVWIPGDTDASGKIEPLDAILVLQHCAGWNVTMNTELADVTGDGMIGISDALKILQDCMGGDIAKAMRALQRMLADLNASSLVITEQPADQCVMAGETATFTVVATGDALKYQWYIDRNDGNGWQKLNNAVDAIYVTSKTEADNDGYQYRCVITDAHGAEVTSDAVVLHVVLELPNTGDASTPALWLAMCMLSMIGMMILKRRTAVE